MIDSHCHLNLSQFDTDLSVILVRMQEKGVRQAIVVGVDGKSSERALKLAAKYDNLFAACGFHPTEIQTKTWSQDLLLLERQVLSTDCVAVGEVGLDFSNEHNLSVDEQLNYLKNQIDVAKKLNKPVIFHLRRANDAFIEFAKSGHLPKKAVVHCFEGDHSFLKRILDFGLMVSLSGLITYPKNQFIREAAAFLPHDRAMIETDSPFLAPGNLRGTRNDPTGAIYVATELAKLWQTSLDHVDKITTINSMKFFNLPDII